MTDFRVLITGSRHWPDRTWLNMDLDLLLLYATRRNRRMVVVHGAHWSGVDLYVNDWCNGMGVLRRDGRLHMESYPADWGMFRSGAGPRRNRHMVSLGADLCLAYPKGESKGTRGCAQLARDAGIPTLVTEYGLNVTQTLEYRLRAAGIMILEEK